METAARISKYRFHPSPRKRQLFPYLVDFFSYLYVLYCRGLTAPSTQWSSSRRDSWTIFELCCHTCEIRRYLSCPTPSHSIQTPGRPVARVTERSLSLSYSDNRARPDLRLPHRESYPGPLDRQSSALPLKLMCPLCLQCLTKFGS